MKPAAVEVDAIKIRKLNAFREEVKRASEGSTLQRVYKEFQSLQDFAEAATQSVAELRRLLDEHKHRDESRGRSPNDPAKALQVVIEHAEWSPFNHVALILAMRVSVANRTDTRKRLTGFQFYSGGQVANGFDDPEVSREVERLKQQHNLLNQTSVLEPWATVTGWMVYPFPWKATRGEPEYTFSVLDELEKQYEAAKTYAGSEVGGPPPDGTVAV